ncbi:oxygen-independent coproporphyrinogen III oxidase [Thermosulfidibacter takaii ABI70S6]|uniref:Heme chaperone HemW n=1 Tax=Thermosulfidibacter takaii (strain DSM 17441 / JCM 13301 / NBRC 103674 / ABI70S6) TaxID=1298851 RepID=A0A0S3QRF2_THET7|nr:radical SAM family heme chaperone HemW [Thermosulfidibacter takaii]BAT70918.1 oxygen-independent coproporphyrinogen III oxidase [Thermosulfidibacter takaii ABI70S6]
MKGENRTLKESRVRLKGLYVHIPFCVKKCSYCAFYSVPYEEGLIKPLFQAILKELEERRVYLAPSYTLYVGGGTPTVCGFELVRFLERLLKRITADPVEFTVEANPATFDIHLLKALRALGVTRISLGVQSFDDYCLSFLGRVHTGVEAKRTLQLALGIFENVNIDLIFAVPGQSKGAFVRDLQTAIQFPIKHISLYGLTFEEGTLLYERFLKKEIEPVSDEEWEDFYLLAHEYLSEKGFVHYEVSNYAVKGYHCLHNLMYWRCREYVGLGPAAASFIEGCREKNPESIKEYMEGINTGSLKRKREKVLNIWHEKVMLGLRVLSGVNLKGFPEIVRKQLLDKAKPLIQEGFLEYQPPCLRIPVGKMPVMNSILAFLL